MVLWHWSKFTNSIVCSFVLTAGINFGIWWTYTVCIVFILIPVLVV